MGNLPEFSMIPAQHNPPQAEGQSEEEPAKSNENKDLSKEWSWFADLYLEALIFLLKVEQIIINYPQKLNKVRFGCCFSGNLYLLLRWRIGGFVNLEAVGIFNWPR